MTAFALTAAALSLLALAPLLHALLRRPADTAAASPDRAALNLRLLREARQALDDELESGQLSLAAYDAARQELAHRVSQDVVAPPAPPAAARIDHPHRPSAWALAATLPLAAAALYALTGTPAALQALQGVQATAAAQATQADPAMTPERIQGMVARLAERMKRQPDDVQGWRMLARAYETLGRFDDAVAAYRQLQRLTPDDSAMLLDYAVTLAMVKGRTLSGEPAALIQRVLTLQPGNLQALALAGSEAYERQDYPTAVRHWQAVLAQVPPGTEMAQSVQASIEKARRKEIP